MRNVYLDYNATTPVAPEVAAAMEPFQRTIFGNPSSAHWAGEPARDAIDRARCQVASLLGCDATEVIFTSGGTEANNLALKGTYYAALHQVPRPHFIISAVEHPAVTEPCRFLARLGAEITVVPVDRQGMIDPDDVARAIRPDTVLISVMHANNEVGTIQPIDELVSIAREHGVRLHSDAAQTVGKLGIDTVVLGVDLLTVAGHKLYAPKGVGALIVRDGVPLEPLLHGAGHEAGRRASTENVSAIVALGAACELAQRWVDDPSLVRRRDGFWARLQQAFGSRVVLHGHPTRRLPNTLNVSFRGEQGHELLARLTGVAASTGSACHAGSLQISPVLEAMGVPQETALGAVRFSLGRETTVDELDDVVERLTRIVKPTERITGKYYSSPRGT